MTQHLADSTTQVNAPRRTFVREAWSVGKARHSEAGRRLAKLLVELANEIAREQGEYGSQRRVAELTGIDTAQVTTILADPDAPRDVSGRTIEGVVKRMGLRADYFFGPVTPASYRDFLGRPSDLAGASGRVAAPGVGPLVVLEMAKDLHGSKAPLTPAEMERLLAIAETMPSADKATLRDHLDSFLVGIRQRAKARTAERPARRK